jgi:ATP-dependent helicase HrpA
VRYRELLDDQTQGIVDAVEELMREGRGDVLVFLSGEREIRDAADALQKIRPKRVVDEFEVLPLYARLSAAEQHRVFAPHAKRRVVLATNVAETSLTVPGIHYVVDTGLARISRFSARTKVQRLPIEPISRASADQRKGRCGRVAAGICIRLYAEEDFESRPAFTDPEILRTNLASVILQMAALDLGDIARFPFVEPPDTRSVQAGLQLLDEIGAITPEAQGVSSPARRRRQGAKRSDRLRGGPGLTRIGRDLAQVPIDPRLGRMMIEASREDCLREVITIVAALSIQDPRERPSELQELADQKHRRFADPASDFAGILNLWRYVKEQQDDLSSSAFRRLCKREFLNYLRIREWQDLDAQLRQVAKQLGFTMHKGPAGSDAVHRSLLAGLLSHIGMKDGERRDYLGARGTRFAIFPGSALFRKQPEFVMAAELVETGRLWGRVNAAIEPAWAEALAPHLIKRSYSEPHWEKKQGAVVAFEKVTLYGVPIVSERKVNYGRIDRATSRELFIRHALVAGDWHTRHRFFHHNQALLEEAQELEQRTRRRDIVVDDETLFDLYDARVPQDVVSVRHFDSWWKKQHHETPDLLTFSLDMLVHETASLASGEDYPMVWRHADIELPLAYAFDPGTAGDGVTVDIPVTALNQVTETEFTWPVPGLRQELVVALLRSLPKSLRVSFVPAPDHARAFLAAATPGEEPLLDALERHLLRTTGVRVGRADWDWEKVPPHLRLTFRVLAEDGAVLGESKRLDDLKRLLRQEAGSAISTAAGGLERDGITEWDLDALPTTFTQTRAGHEVRGYPALVDKVDSVSIRVFGSEPAQHATMWLGTRRLLMLNAGSPAAAIANELGNNDKLALGLNPHGGVAALLDDCYACAVDAVLEQEGGPAWNREGFRQLQRAVEERSEQLVRDVVALVGPLLVDAYAVDRRLSGRAELALLPALADMKAQWGRLVHPGFIAEAGLAALARYPTYFAAMQQRLEKLAADPRRDAVLMATVVGVQQAYLDRIEALPAGIPPSHDLAEVRWMIEELRVSLWAQQLRTPRPVSVERVERALSQL